MVASVIGIVIATTIALISITMKFYMGGCCNTTQTVNEKSK